MTFKQPHDPSRISRRAVLRTVGWGVPAITVAAAAPAYARSAEALDVDPCPVAAGQIRWSVGLSFAGLSLTNRWVSGVSTGTFTFRIGATSGTSTLAAVQFTSATSGLVAQVQDDEYYVTTPYAVQWASAPNGWTITNLGGNQWRFRRTDASTVKTANVATPADIAVISGATGSLVPASPTFQATIVSSSMTDRQVVSATVKVPVGARVTRQVRNPARPACDQPVQVSTPSQTMNLAPSGLRTLAMAAPSTSDSTSISLSGTATTVV